VAAPRNFVTCKTCGALNADEQYSCTNCGADLSPPGIRSLGVAAYWLILIGIVLGFFGLLLLWGTGTMFQNILPPQPHPAEFEPSRGSSLAWIVESAGLIAGLAYLLSLKARRRIAPDVRIVVTAAVFTMMGGMLVCDVAAVPALLAHNRP
jgi:Zn-dependent membrane protease YugP